MLKRSICVAALAAALGTASPALATVTTSSNSVSCTAPGGAFTCPLPFYFQKNTDLVVMIGGALKALGTDYTVTCAGCSSGGSVTAVVSPTVGTVMQVTRFVPYLQTFNARAQGKFQPGSYESAFDNLEFQIQQLAPPNVVCTGTQHLTSNGSTYYCSQDTGAAASGTFVTLQATPSGTTDSGNLHISGEIAGGVTATGGNTRRTLADRFSEAKNIKDFGAACDGSTDDSAAIQAAVTAALAVNGAVYIPPSASGCVIPTSGGALNQINITGPLTVYGAGPSSVIYIKGSTWKSGGNTGYFQVSNGSSTIADISFHDFRFIGDYQFTTGTRTSPSGAQGAIVFGSSSTTLVVNNGVVTRMTFERLGGPGVQWNGGSNDPTVCCQSSGNIVSDSVFVNSGSSNDQVNPFSGGSTGTIITGNSFKDISQIAIEWSGMAAVIANNYFDNVLYSPIVTESASTQTGWTTIAGNVIKNSGYQGGGLTTSAPCVQLGESVGVYRYRVIGNVISNCAGDGIATAGSTSSSDVSIENNYIDCAGWKGSGRTDALGGAGFAGITLSNRNRVRVTGNHVRACTGGSDSSSYGITTGGTAAVDYWVDGNTTSGTFATASLLLPASLGASGAGTRSYVGGGNFDMTAGARVAPANSSNTLMVPVFTSGATAPSVGGSSAWVTNNAGATAITTFSNGYLGQTFTLVSGDANTTLTQGTTLILRNGASRKMVSGEVTQFTQDGSGYWREVPSFSFPTSAFSALGTPSNGAFLYCSDCTIANPCAGGGTGALAKRLNGVWVCN